MDELDEAYEAIRFAEPDDPIPRDHIWKMLLVLRDLDRRISESDAPKYRHKGGNIFELADD